MTAGRKLLDHTKRVAIPYYETTSEVALAGNPVRCSLAIELDLRMVFVVVSGGCFAGMGFSPGPQSRSMDWRWLILPLGATSELTAVSGESKTPLSGIVSLVGPQIHPDVNTRKNTPLARSPMLNPHTFSSIPNRAVLLTVNTIVSGTCDLTAPSYRQATPVTLPTRTFPTGDDAPFPLPWIQSRTLTTATTRPQQHTSHDSRHNGFQCVPQRAPSALDGQGSAEEEAWSSSQARP